MFQPQVHALSALILKRHSKCQHSGGELRVCFTATVLYSSQMVKAQQQIYNRMGGKKEKTEVIAVVGQTADLNPTEI